MIDARQAVLTPDGARGGALPLVRSAFRALSIVSPSLAGRAAERLWFTPPRPRVSAASRAILDTGVRADTLVHGRNVAAWSWGDGPTVLLMHGWGGTAAQMVSYAEPLVRAGYRAIAFDAPAHGASGASRLGRRQATFFDFADALVEIAAKAAPLAGVITHSGGCTATSWAIREGWRVPSAVFVAPMGSPSAYRTMFQRAIGLSDEALRRFSARAERRIGFRWEEMEVSAVPRIAKTPPLLVIHDRDDEETPWHEGAAIAASWPDATLRTTTGLGHRRALRDAESVAAAVDFVTSRTDSPQRVFVESTCTTPPA